MMKRVAIVGGGIFGTTAAIYVARAGYDVHLFEREEDILRAASGINQYRLHRGYHYPRSSETARSALAAESSFREEYGSAVIDGGRHLYAIAREGSLVTAEEFLNFCKAHNLSYRKVQPERLLNKEKVTCVIEGTEAWYDPNMLRVLVEGKLREAGVKIHYNTIADEMLLGSFDRVVMAAYAGHNQTAPTHLARREHQYEVCEKPVVSMPAWFGLTGVVILDGPFMCIDPLGREGLYVLGNVVHAVHAQNIGFAPDVPAQLQPYLNRGIVQAPSITRFEDFIRSGSVYIPALSHARHIGSMYTVRTVLPNLEHSDARPTHVRQLDGRHIKIFSGKVGNCVEAARQVVKFLHEELVDTKHTKAKVTT